MGKPRGRFLKYDHDAVAGMYNQLTDIISLYQTVKTKNYLLQKVGGNKALLEIGCGNGDLAISCAKKCSHVTGLNVSKKMIENAKAYAKKKNIANVKFIQRAIKQWVRVL